MATRWGLRVLAAAMAEQRWTVECADLFGRSRGITVLTHVGRIVMVVPAGESALLTASEVDELTGALDAAIATNRHNGIAGISGFDRLGRRTAGNRSQSNRR
jgi:hypothetical protein